MENGGGIHRLRDAEKLALHLAIAEQLRANPERVLAIAHENLRRWRTSMGVQPYHERWLTILGEWPLDRIAAAITADDEIGRDLRQSTPFTGVLSPQERDDIIRVARVTARADDALGDPEKASRWLGAYSGPIRPRVPGQSVHGFRSKASTDSGDAVLPFRHNPSTLS